MTPLLKLRVPALLAAVLVTLFVAAGPAAADPAGRITDLKINYRLDTAGVLHVQETFTWDFGGIAHGMQRELITREPDPTTGKDMVYTISNFRVTSPDPDVSTKVSTTDNGGPLDRNRSTVYRIGDPGQLIMNQPTTYVINYDETGTVRTSGNYDELYWDATGAANPAIDETTITASVPGGAQDVRCYAGPVGSNAPCAGAAKDTTRAAQFTATKLAAGDNVTIGVKIKPGLISDDHPHLVARASFGQVLKTPVTMISGVLSLLITLAIIGWGLLRARRRNTDRRFLDLPPGTLPEPGSQPRIGPSAIGVEIPVRFEPPETPVAEAAYLVDGRYSERITAAVLVSLAVSGAIRIAAPQQGNSVLGVDLLDKGAATGAVESAVVAELFRKSHDRRDIAHRGSLVGEARTARRVTLAEVTRRGWFDRMPSNPDTVSASGLTTLIVFGLLGLGALLLASVVLPFWPSGQLGPGFPFAIFFIIPPVLALVGAVLLPLWRGTRGRRSAAGRAMADQVTGFRQYLATAEADQLKFEEGRTSSPGISPGRSLSILPTVGSGSASNSSDPDGSHNRLPHGWAT
ncbi:hypothetical protein GCM10027613_35830 [Microlunatus endophyticus]